MGGRLLLRKGSMGRSQLCNSRAGLYENEMGRFERGGGVK